MIFYSFPQQSHKYNQLLYNSMLTVLLLPVIFHAVSATIEQRLMALMQQITQSMNSFLEQDHMECQDQSRSFIEYNFANILSIFKMTICGRNCQQIIDDHFENVKQKMIKMELRKMKQKDKDIIKSELTINCLKLDIFQRINTFTDHHNVNDPTAKAQILLGIRDMVESMLAPFDDCIMRAKEDKKPPKQDNLFNQIREKIESIAQSYFIKDSYSTQNDNVLDCQPAQVLLNVSHQECFQSGVECASNERQKQQNKKNSQNLQQQTSLPYDLLAKKRKKQSDDILTESSFVDQLSRQKIQIFQQLKKLKKEGITANLLSIQQSMWFFSLGDQQTGRKIEKFEEKELIQLKKEIQAVKSKKAGIDQVCSLHHKKVNYICSTEYLKRHIYLCDDCIIQSSDTDQHFGHDITCKIHKKSIKYRRNTNARKQSADSLCFQLLSQLKQQGQQHFFMCQQCGLDSSQQRQIITTCHYVPIKEICLDFDCIQNDSFRICPKCNLDKHFNHEKVAFTKQSLMKTFALQRQQDVTIFQSQYIDVIERIKANPINKSLNQTVKRYWSIIKFVESFAVYNNQNLEKWVQQVTSSGTREDLFVLRGVKKLKQLNYKEQDKKCRLQAYNDLLKMQLDLILPLISQIFQRFYKKMSRINDINQEDIQEAMSKKYEKLINIQSASQVQQYPVSLYHIHPIQCQRVKQIFIRKDRQETEDQKKMQSWKLARNFFYKDEVPRAFKQFKLNQQGQKKVFQMILKQNGCDKYQLAKIPKCQKVYKFLVKRLRDLQKEHQLKMKQCLPISFITKNTFTNLKKLHVEYSVNINKDMPYQISAFRIFEMVSTIHSLEELSILGIKVFAFQQFMKYLRVVKLKYPKKFIKFVKKQGYYQNDINNYIQADSKGRFIYLLDSQYKNQASWIQTFDPSCLRLVRLNGELQYHLFCKHKIMFRDNAQTLLYFSKQFKIVSDVQVKIYLTKYNKLNNWQQNLKTILQSLLKLERLKLVIVSDLREILGQKQDNVMIPLLRQMTKFKEITTLYLQGIQFSQYVSVKQYQQMQRYLKTIFQNNLIIDLKLYSCQNMFILSQGLQCLQAIHLDGGIYLYGGQYYRKQFSPMLEITKANKNLKFIKNISTKQMQRVSLKDQLNIQAIYSTCNQWITDDNLSQIYCQSLKYLQICNSKQKLVTCNSLTMIFPKMTNIVQLAFESVDFKGELLLSIPSANLKQLHLTDNSQLTSDDMQDVDSKWPHLLKITLYKCKQVDGRIFTLCKFKGLFLLTISQRLLQQNQKTLRCLKQRGLQVITR